jgi:hypothetical protein
MNMPLQPIIGRVTAAYGKACKLAAAALAAAAAGALTSLVGAGSIHSGQRVALSSIVNDNLGRRTTTPAGGSAPDFVTVSATVQFIKNDPGTMYYPACTNDFNGR